MKLKSIKDFTYGTWAYTQITDLDYQMSGKLSEVIIDEVIKSKWLQYQNKEHPDGMTWHWDQINGESETFRNLRMHGHYDVDLLTSSDFKIIPNDQLIEILLNYIKSNISADEKRDSYINSIVNYLSERFTEKFECYQLKVEEGTKKSMIQIYSFFISLLILTKSENRITLIEFGQD